MWWHGEFRDLFFKERSSGNVSLSLKLRCQSYTIEEGIDVAVARQFLLYFLRNDLKTVIYLFEDLI